VAKFLREELNSCVDLESAVHQLQQWQQQLHKKELAKHTRSKDKCSNKKTRKAKAGGKAQGAAKQGDADATGTNPTDAVAAVELPIATNNIILSAFIADEWDAFWLGQVIQENGSSRGVQLHVKWYERLIQEGCYKEENAEIDIVASTEVLKHTVQLHRSANSNGWQLDGGTCAELEMLASQFEGECKDELDPPCILCGQVDGEDADDLGLFCDACDKFYHQHCLRSYGVEWKESDVDGSSDWH